MAKSLLTFRSDFGWSVWPKSRPQKFFSWVLPLLDARNCHKLSLYSVSRTTYGPNWRKCRLVFGRFLDLRGNLGMLKKNRLEELVSLGRRSAWLHASILQNFARWHFFDVNKVSNVFSWEIVIKTGESIWKVLQKHYKKHYKNCTKRPKS